MANVGESESHSVVSDSLRPHGLYSPWNSLGQNTRVGSLSLLQQIFLTQKSNWGLLHRRQILYQLSYQGNPIIYITHPLLMGIYIVPNFLRIRKYLERNFKLLAVTLRLELCRDDIQAADYFL